MSSLGAQHRTAKEHLGGGAAAGGERAQQATSSVSPYPVRAGEVVGGKYVVERFLGEGGMGVVVAARHIGLDHQVAIKFLQPQIASDLTASQRFRREARAAARIRGDHACRVLDVAALDSGVPYIVLEYLDGCDLATELQRRRRLPAEEAVDYVLQACEALAEAHAEGVVHRDLKPGNLYLASSVEGTRCLKVLDFGVSKLLRDREIASLTMTSSMIGSPLYMSPEQLESARDVDARTDIWSLGVVLFELIVGRPPFVGTTLAQLTHQVLSARPPSCASLGVPVPEGLEAVLLRALAKPREQRFASVADFARALVPFGPVHGAVSAARAVRLLPGSSVVRSSLLTRSGLSPKRLLQPGPTLTFIASEPAPPPRATRLRTFRARLSRVRPARRHSARIAAAIAALVLAITAAMYLTAGEPEAEVTLPAQAVRETAAPQVAPTPLQIEPLPAAATQPGAESFAVTPAHQPSPTPRPQTPRAALKAPAQASRRAAVQPSATQPQPARSVESAFPVSDFGGRR